MKNTTMEVIKKIRSGFGFAALVAGLWMTAQLPLHAAEFGDYEWDDKLGRGVLNIVSSPVEVARTIHVESEVRGNGYGWTAGLVKGLGRTIVRLGAGVVDLVTFPFDFPDENKAPLIEPEYAWQKWAGDTVL